MSVPAVKPMKFDVIARRSYYVSFDFMENVKYRFWVTADNGERVGGRSAIESLDYSAVVSLDSIENARLVSKNDTFFGFAWDEHATQAGARNYSVQCQSENPYEPKHVINVTTTTAVGKLSCN
jgi:hypothetical protein